MSSEETFDCTEKVIGLTSYVAGVVTFLLYGSG